MVMNCLIGGVLGGCSNATSQLLRGVTVDAMDTTAILYFTIIPAFVMTPVSSIWFDALGSLQLSRPLQLAVDTTVGAVLLNSLFMIALGALQGEVWESVTAKLASRWFFVDIVAGSNKVWFPAKLVMFYFIPPMYYPMWCNFVSFGWTIILSTLVA